MAAVIQRIPGIIKLITELLSSNDIDGSERDHHVQAN